MRYSLFFGNGAARPAQLTRLGAAFNHPFIHTPATLHIGDAPARLGYATVATDNVVLTALKTAEDGDGIIVRLSELNGEDTEASVVFDPAFAAGLSTAACVDLMERPRAGGAAGFSGNTLRASVPAYGFVTVRVR